jgi:HPt (histidine-containing phosphotransfer) domain-containing protein
MEHSCHIYVKQINFLYNGYQILLQFLRIFSNPGSRLFPLPGTGPQLSENTARESLEANPQWLSACNEASCGMPASIEQRIKAFRSKTTIRLSPNSMVEFMVMTSVDQRTGVPPVWSLTPDLKEIAAADSGMMLELVSLFIDDSTVRLQTLNGACFRQDFTVLRAQAHSLKGSALQMGAVGLASLCAALESADKPEPDRYGPMMRAIDDEFVHVRLAMEEYLVNAETAVLSQAG